jgi:hypothetical protein
VKFVFLDFDGVITTAQTYNRWRKKCWSDLQRERGLSQELIAEAASPSSVPWREGFTQAMLRERRNLPLLFDRQLCANVQTLCQEAGADIILSTAWRESCTNEELASLISSRGLTIQIVGRTPVYTGRNRRGREIEHVVEHLGLKLQDFVILEDMEDVKPFESRCVRTTLTGNKAGFTLRHLQFARRLFGLPTDATYTE